jgi:putative nucleotidyltransferase with HDIG domain
MISTGTPGLTPAKLVRRAQEISSLPQVAIRVMEIANDDSSDATDLKTVMESDAALSTRVLRCVNSSAFATRTQVTNLQQAIAYLGVRQIRNLAMTASVAELFQTDEAIGPYRRKGLWGHFVAVGICARLLAMHMKLQAFEDAFLAGLLHDIGIVLEDQFAHKPFERVMQAVEGHESLGKAEREVLGFDHMVLGKELAQHWKFPDAVVDAIRHHHDSSRCQGDHLQIVQCVEVANLICSLKGYTSIGLNRVAFPESAIKALALKKQDILVLAEEFEQQLASSGDLFQI